MIILKEIDLTDAELKKQKILGMKVELEKEQAELKDMLVALNLNYYGMPPHKYYEEVHKEYITEDGYSVLINQGQITISKKLQNNLTITWIGDFDANTKFSLYKSFFRYDSGRYIQNFRDKDRIAKKYKSEIEKFCHIIEQELIHDPFTEYRAFYSFTDF